LEAFPGPETSIGHNESSAIRFRPEAPSPPPPPIAGRRGVGTLLLRQGDPFDRSFRRANEPRRFPSPRLYTILASNTCVPAPELMRTNTFFSGAPKPLFRPLAPRTGRPTIPARLVAREGARPIRRRNAREGRGEAAFCHRPAMWARLGNRVRALWGRSPARRGRSTPTPRKEAGRRVWSEGRRRSGLFDRTQRPSRSEPIAIEAVRSRHEILNFAARGSSSTFTEDHAGRRPGAYFPEDVASAHLGPRFPVDGESAGICKRLAAGRLDGENRAPRMSAGTGAPSPRWGPNLAPRAPRAITTGPRLFVYLSRGPAYAFPPNHGGRLRRWCRCGVDRRLFAGTNPAPRAGACGRRIPPPPRSRRAEGAVGGDRHLSRGRHRPLRGPGICVGPFFRRRSRIPRAGRCLTSHRPERKPTSLANWRRAGVS